MSVLTRAYGAQLEIRGDGRTIVGVAVPYNVQTRIGRYVESFAVGAFADAGTHVLTARHPETNDVLPIGVSVETEDRVDGLHGAWRVSEVPLGEQVLTLVRDRVPLGLSIGFIEIPGADQWNAPAPGSYAPEPPSTTSQSRGFRPTTPPGSSAYGTHRAQGTRC